jgi:hypothetical protein
MPSKNILFLTLFQHLSYFRSFAMTSGLKLSASSSRSLKFHDEDNSSIVTHRYCAIWNPDINGIGAWDTAGLNLI